LERALWLIVAAGLFLGISHVMLSQMGQGPPTGPASLEGAKSGASLMSYGIETVVPGIDEARRLLDISPRTAWGTSGQRELALTTTERAPEGQATDTSKAEEVGEYPVFDTTGFCVARLTFRHADSDLMRSTVEELGGVVLDIVDSEAYSLVPSSSSSELDSLVQTGVLSSYEVGGWGGGVGKA